MSNKNLSQGNDGLLTVARLIEMLQTLPAEALVVVANPPSSRRHCRQEERYFKTLEDAPLTVESVICDGTSQGAVLDLSSSFDAHPKESIKAAVCLQLKY